MISVHYFVVTRKFQQVQKLSVKV